jgi:hypothetical protein
MTDRERNTLAARELEELFFQLCCCVSFWFWREIGFSLAYLRTLLNKLFYELIVFLIVVEILAMFFTGFLCQSNYNLKEKRYSHLAVGWNKSQITVCRVKIRTTPITLYFQKILIGFLCFTETLRSKLSATVYLFLALNGSTTLQSRLFLKNIENFLCK